MANFYQDKCYYNNMIHIIVAYDRNRAIGDGQRLLWQGDLPADMRHFRELTAGQAVIMGLKTYQSIGRPLPNRQNIVLDFDNRSIESVQVAPDLQAAYRLVEPDRAGFIIGGGQVYKQTIKDAGKIYATEIEAEMSGATVFFPELDPDHWREVSRDRHEPDERNKYAYDFVEYVRR